MALEAQRESGRTATSGAGEIAGATRAPVLEVFASVQGEGIFVGEPQVFVRLFGCPLRCRWCDTPGSWELPAAPRARIAAPGRTRREPGWAEPFQVAAWVQEVELGHARTVSVTGGEPLLWPDFVRELKRALGPRRLHLETAGAHPRALAQVLECVDHVSLDLKLPADLDAPVPVSTGAGAEEVPHGPGAWARVRARMLALVRGRDACGKVIVAGGHAPEAYRPLLDDVQELAPGLPLVLQPVTPLHGVLPCDPDTLAALVELALERSLTVRVLPQVHRLLGVP